MLSLARRFFLLSLAALILGAALLLFIGITLPPAGPAKAAQDGTPAAPTATPHVATAEELLAAKAEWSESAHADTFDNGQGANTTCARCKSPLNWDPLAPAAPMALDCASCKRVPGQPRPELEGGIPVEKADWHDIGCEICHEPSGDSFMTSIAYWDNASQQYQEVEDAQELCEQCHEGRHGFEVIEEQIASAVHQDWECTRCHGAHGEPATCEACHDVTQGAAVEDHQRHPMVNCTACHDRGQLTIVQDLDPDSRFYGSYIPIRYAHTLTSWPSHNLQTAVDCRRCHHRPNEYFPAVANQTGCDATGCHDQGAVLHWCPLFKRDPPPEGAQTP